MIQWIGHFDGACEPVNPGGWMISAAVIVPPDGEFSPWGGDTVPPSPKNTNNCAEWAALELLLKNFKAMFENAPREPGVEIVIRGDSKLVINQFNGDWRCNDQRMAEARDRCQALAKEITAGGVRTLRVEWVPREENVIADQVTAHLYTKETGKQMPERGKGRVRHA